MSYNHHNLSVLAYANGFTLWHYTSPDDAAAVDATGYFNSAADVLRVGDMILANVNDGAAGAIYLVNANHAITITVTNLTPAPRLDEGAV